MDEEHVPTDTSFIHSRVAFFPSEFELVTSKSLSFDLSVLKAAPETADVKM